MEALAGLVRRHEAARGRPASLADVLRDPRVDPWGNAYVLDADGTALAVRSYGPDGRPGTPDDIVHSATPPPPEPPAR